MTAVKRKVDKILHFLLLCLSYIIMLWMVFKAEIKGKWGWNEIRKLKVMSPSLFILLTRPRDISTFCLLSEILIKFSIYITIRKEILNLPKAFIWLAFLVENSDVYWPSQVAKIMNTVKKIWDIDRMDRFSKS